MANIENIKIGELTPSSILYASPRVYHKDGLFTHYKFANDAGGYYVKGLWLAPYYNKNKYWWPWDLNVPNGALKDLNEGWRHWGYVQDGSNKNITQDMTVNFPTNGWNADNWGIALTLYCDTASANYTDEAGVKYMDFGDKPIVIEFLDDRFDQGTWTVPDSSVVEVSPEDRRTFTIYRIPVSGTYSFVVAYWHDDDKSVANIRTKLTNVRVDVRGLSYHYSTINREYPDSVECWDGYVGDTQVYHKDKTFENNWRKYGYVTERTATIDDYQSTHDVTIYDIHDSPNITEGNSCGISTITDLEDYIQHTETVRLESRLKHILHFNITQTDTKLWDDVKEYFRTHPMHIFFPCAGGFKDSGIDGDLTIILNSNAFNFPVGITAFYSFDDFISGTKLTSIFIKGERPYDMIGSFHNMFRGASWLEHIYCSNINSRAQDVMGAFEGCNSLKTILPNLINWSSRLNDYTYNVGINNVSWAYEHTISLKSIPGVNFSEEDRYTNANTIILAPGSVQVFNGSVVTYIGPVIDACLAKPESCNLIFAAGDLEDVRIKNLNNGDWSLDGVTRNGVVHGNLAKLDADSVAYLINNLSDLVNQDSNTTNIPSVNNCWGKWKIINGTSNYIYNYKGLVLRDRISSIGPTKTKEALDLNITVSGLQTGDVLKFTDETGTDMYTITADGDYNIQADSSDAYKFFSLSNSEDFGSSLEVGITINSNLDRTKPSVNSANLYLPEALRDKIDSTMVQGANAKGWTIYVGGEILTY